MGTGGISVTIQVEQGREELRDYFLRLGATAAIDENGAVNVCLEERDHGTVEEYLASWTSVNKRPATIKPAPNAGRAELIGNPALFGDVALRPRLGEVLVGRHLITETQLEEALAETAKSGDLLGRVLLRRRWLFEDELARALSEQLQIPYINIRSSGVDQRMARMVPAEVGLRYAAIPIGVVQGRLRVAFADPCDQTACAEITRHCGDYEITVAELSDIVLAWHDIAGPSSA
jgi:hypothetical protein